MDFLPQTTIFPIKYQAVTIARISRNYTLYAAATAIIEQHRPQTAQYFTKSLIKEP